MRREELEFFTAFESEEAAQAHYQDNPYATTFEDSVIIARVAPYSVAAVVEAYEKGDTTLRDINLEYRENLNT